MQKIHCEDGTLLAIIESFGAKGGTGRTFWYGDAYEAIQVAQFQYDKGKEFRGHRHILRPRLNNYTQECIIVVSGALALRLYDIDKTPRWEGIVPAGNFFIAYRGYHQFDVIEDGTSFLEVKNGPFTTVAEDKEYL